MLASAASFSRRALKALPEWQVSTSMMRRPLLVSIDHGTLIPASPFELRVGRQEEIVRAVVEPVAGEKQHDGVVRPGIAKRLQRSLDIGGGRRPVAAFGQDQAAGL